MTNKKKKITAIVMFLIALGLLIYNISNPYQEKTDESKNHSHISSSSSQDDKSHYDSIVASVVDSIVSEEQTANEPSQESVWREKYKGNSLKNGAQPYSAIYGMNKQSGTSTIVVTAPTDRDALVMVKNNKGKVLRHAYIKSRDKYTFHISAGYYQVYFICGSDWCPEKEAPNGQKGFFLDSSTSKDNVLYIDDYQELTYTLQSMVNGNFMPSSASSEEAF